MPDDESSGSDSDDVSCEKCGSSDDSKDAILLCDGCDSGYHIGCLPGKRLAAIPKGNWYCPSCLTARGSKKASANWRNLMGEGYNVLAKDTTGKWLEGKVIEVDAKQQVLVHFLGWNSKFDEWYSRDSDKIQPLDAPPGLVPKKPPAPEKGSTAAKVAAEKAAAKKVAAKKGA